MFRYYIVDFPVEKRVASILQLSSLSRDPNFWGSSRLAVQGTYYGDPTRVNPQ